MSNERRDPRLVIDYTQSAPAVYNFFARRLIEIDESLHVLACANQNRNLPLPSWVPDFSQPASSAWLSGLDISCGVPFSASGSTTPIVKDLEDPSALSLRGFQFDRINRCLSLGDKIVTAPGDSIGAILMGIIEQYRSDLTFATASEQADIVMYSTLSVDIGPTCDRLLDNAKLLRFPKATNWFKHHSLDDQMDGEAGIEPAHHIQSMLVGRDVFLTERGYLVLGPRGATVNDVVCILYGAVVPFILRRQGQGCELVGECYVHGIMDGEAMLKFRDYAEEDFVLF